MVFIKGDGIMVIHIESTEKRKTINSNIQYKSNAAALINNLVEFSKVVRVSEVVDKNTKNIRFIYNNIILELGLGDYFYKKIFNNDPKEYKITVVGFKDVWVATRFSGIKVKNGITFEVDLDLNDSLDEKDNLKFLNTDILSQFIYRKDTMQVRFNNLNVYFWIDPETKKVRFTI